MAEPASFDPEALIERFRERAAGVRRRQIPPVEGPARADFVKQAKQDFFDYSIIGDASAELEDGILTLTVNLRSDP